MTSEQRFEQDLPDLLEDLFMGPMPTYRDDLLWQTAHTSQRPGWTFFERWLPMVDIARQPVLAPGIPIRTIGLGLLIVGLLLAAVAALVLGSRPNLPAPFGLARNGLVAYAVDGDIFTVDPTTGIASAIVTGPETDVDPRWSLDGTQLVFERKASEGSDARGWLYVADADGSDLTMLTPEPLLYVETYAFSPTGREVLVTSTVDGFAQMSVAMADGSGIRTLDLGLKVEEPAWRPPDGIEIIFTGAQRHLSRTGIYKVEADGSNLRAIVAPESEDLGHPTWSPDGSRIAYWSWRLASTLTVRTHVASADGTRDRLLPTHPDAVWEAAMTWSNDGTRLIAIRGNTGGFEGSRAVVISADGSGDGVEMDFPGDINGHCCPLFEWAPDDSAILATPVDPTGLPHQQVLLNPVTGTANPAAWTTASSPAWQRLAP